MEDDKLKNQPEDEKDKDPKNPPADEPDPSKDQDGADDADDGDENPDDAGDDNPDDGDDGGNAGDDEEQPPSPRESKRIKALTEKLARASESRQPGQPGTPDDPFKEREEGYELEEANKIAKDFGADQYQKGLESAKALEFKVNLRIDAPKVAQKYDIMNSNSDDYDPSRTAFINELYLRTVGYDPNSGNVRDASLGYEEFVDGIMEAVGRQAAADSADTATNIAKQKARQGMRPTGGTKKAYAGTDPSKMSDEQLDAVIAQSLRK